MPEGVGYSGSNVVAGAGLELNYIGSHCYAYGGAYSASSTAANHLDFTTGNKYILGRLYLNGTIESGSGSGEITTADIKFNGVTVARLKVDSAEEDQPNTSFNDLLIPAYTHVEVEVDSSGTNSGRFSTLVFTGRLYE